MSDTQDDAIETERNKGGRPRKPIDTTAPEFREAVSAAVQEAVPGILAAFAAARGGSTATQSGDESFVQQLALAIAEISDQGTSRKRVAPEILAKREAARKRMVALLVQAHEDVRNRNLMPAVARAQGLVPEYRVTNVTYLNETLIQAFRTDPVSKKIMPNEIYWSGPPNECMRPLNDIAKPIFEAFMESIGGLTAVSQKSDNRPVWVTPGGLVVKGVTNSRREVSGLADSNAPNAFTDDLGLKGAHDPTAEFVHVLGTIAEPARQNYLGEANR